MEGIVMKGLAGILALFALSGCGTTSVSPLGSDQYAIECLDSVGYCAQKANEVCPSGVDVVDNTSNGHSRYAMIVKCKD